MAISMTARKALWARSANFCAFPDCNQQLTEDIRDGESGVLHSSGVPIGEEAHIFSGSSGGPRGGEIYPEDKIDSYENLILLCPTHHRIIDKQRGVAYTADTLRKMKSEHEAAWAAKKSASDKRFEEVELRTIALIEKWSVDASLQEWEGVTWRLNSPVPRLKREYVDSLGEQARWLLGRTWPPAYPLTARAFDNYRVVLTDLVGYVQSNMDYPRSRDDVLEFPRPWNWVGFDHAQFETARAKFQSDVDMLSELSLELTKAANFACDAVREELDPLFRFDDGVLIHRLGDGIFSDVSTREEYSPEERLNTRPYCGLKVLKERVRDHGGASR